MFILDRIDRELHSLERLELKFGLSSEFFNKIPVRILLDVLFRVFRFFKASFYALASSFMTFWNFVAILTLRCMESCHGNFVISHVKLQIITKILHQNYGVICHLWYYRSNVHYLVLLGCVTTLIALSSLGFVTATLITCTLWGELLLPSLYPRVHPTIFSPIYCQRLWHQPDPDHTASHQTL